LISLANRRLLLVLSNALDAPKNPENSGKSLLTYYDTVCLSKNTHVSAMFWLEAKLVVCCGHKWLDARNKVMFKKVGDDGCKINRSVVPSISNVPFLFSTNRYNDTFACIPVEFFHALNTH